VTQVLEVNLVLLATLLDQKVTAVHQEPKENLVNKEKKVFKVLKDPKEIQVLAVKRDKREIVVHSERQEKKEPKENVV